MTLMKNHLQPWAASLPRGNFPDIKNSFKSLAEGPIYRLQWLVAGTLKVQGFLGKGSNRLMDEASTNRNFFVSGRWSFHAIPHWKMPKHKHQIKDETHRTIPLEYTGNFDENSDEYMAMDQYLLIPFLGDEHPFTSYFDVHQGYKVLTHCHIKKKLNSSEFIEFHGNPIVQTIIPRMVPPVFRWSMWCSQESCGLTPARKNAFLVG